MRDSLRVYSGLSFAKTSLIYKLLYRGGKKKVPSGRVKGQRLNCVKRTSGHALFWWEYFLIFIQGEGHAVGGMDSSSGVTPLFKDDPAAGHPLTHVRGSVL